MPYHITIPHRNIPAPGDPRGQNFGFRRGADHLSINGSIFQTYTSFPFPLTSSSFHGSMVGKIRRLAMDWPLAAVVISATWAAVWVWTVHRNKG